MKRRATALTLKPAILKDLLANDAVDSVLVQGVEGGFHILIGFGTEEKPLGLARKDRERVFKTLLSADRYLTKLGIESFAVDKTRHSPAPRKTGAGPGRVAARERLAEAANYAAEVRASVEDAIAQIDAGTAVLIDWSPEENKRAFEASKARVAAKRRAHQNGE